MTVAQDLRDGRLDFWFDQNLLGYPLFIAYQPLPTFVMGSCVALTKSFLSPLFLYKFSIVAIWAAMPALWYVGGRWLGLERTIALVFGLLSLFVRDAWDFGIGFNGTVRYGLYTQLWATAILPVAFGSAFRYVHLRDVNALVVVTFISAVLLCHLILGYLCLLGILLLVPMDRANWLRRLARAGAIVLISLLFCAFWLVPFLLNARYQGGFPYRWESSDGYPVFEAVLKVLAGNVLDFNRLPVLTALGFLGLILAARRWREVSASWLGLFGLVCFLFWLGPATWGSWYRKLPLHGELQVVRYLAGVQFAALFLVAVAIRSILLGATRILLKLEFRHRTSVLDAVAAALFASLVWMWLGAVRGSLVTFDHKGKDYSELVTFLAAGSGRFLCHERLGTADHFHSNLLPLLTGRPHVRTFGRGYHDTLSLYYLDHVQFSPGDFRLYNIHNLVAKSSVAVGEDLARPIWSNQSYQVYEVTRPSTYFEFLHVPLLVLSPDLKSIRDLLLDIDPVLLENNALPAIGSGLHSSADRVEVLGPNEFTLVVDGRPVLARAPASLLKYELLRRYSSLPTVRSLVEQEYCGANEYRARVRVEEGGTSLVLKASFHPYWKALIDDEPALVVPVAPNLMGIDVPPGNHMVRFVYTNPTYQKVFAILSILFWMAWGGWALRANLKAPKAPVVPG